MTTALYCFAERKKELFAEAMMRGYLTAARDWPRCVKTVADAQSACEELRAEVCCVGEDELAYRAMTESAWIAAYVSLGRDVTERDAMKMALVLKQLPFEAAMRFIRPAMSHGLGLAEVESGYAQYLAAVG